MALHRSLVKWALLAALVSLSQGEIGIGGERVVLTCDLPVADPPVVVWKDYVYNPARDPILIADKDGNINPEHPQKDNYEVDIVKHQLTIKRFTKDDAGEYICESDESKVMKKVISLGFVGSPQCVGKTDLEAGHQGELVCEAKYQGSELPRPEWLSPNISETITLSNRDELLVARRAAVFTATPEMNGVTFTCQISVGETVLKKTCTSTLNVMYAVNKIEFEPRRALYVPGEKIKCSANGNPPPTVTWDVEAEVVETGDGYQVITVPESLQHDKQITFACSAKNNIGPMQHIHREVITFVVPVSSAAASTGGAGVAGIVIGLVACLLTRM